MRHIFGMIGLIVLGVSAGAARASPDGAESKSWRVYRGGDRTTYLEQEPNDTCGQAQAMALGDVVTPAFLEAGGQDWYTWTMNAGDLLTCGTGIVNEGDDTDTYIELYANDCATLLTSNDDGGPGLYSLIANYTAPYTGFYFLKVRGYGSATTGPYSFYVNQDIGGLPPPNDRCSGAFEILRCTSGSLQGDTSNANDDYDPSIPGPSCTGYTASGRDVVYFIDAQVGDLLDLTYRQLNTDTSFYIVTDCSNVSGSCVAGADVTMPPESEVIHYTVTASGIYYILLDSYGYASGGPWTLDYSIVGCGPQACCFPDGQCEMVMPPDCLQMGGTPQGIGTTCDPNPCIPTPSKDATWGQIKGSYRR